MTFTFTDNFSPPSPLWSNSIGNWTASNGYYYAQNPSNSPDTYSGLPYDFTNSNLVITVTVHNLGPGGIFIDDDGSTNNGVVFAFGGGGAKGTGLGNSAYWSVWQNGSLNDALNEVDGVFTPGGTSTITVLVNGNTYKAFVDPDGIFDSHSVLLTTLVNNTFSSGHVGLYDFYSGLSFSNFSVSGTLVGPAAPVITTTAPAQDNAASINIIGTADASSTISLYNGAQLVSTTTADNNGNWHFNGITLNDGADYSFSAMETLGGNLSAPSNVLAFHDDQTPPTVTIQSEVLSNSRVTLTGTAGEPNDSISLHDGEMLLGNTATDSNGNWKFTTQTVTNTVHIYSVSATDLAGNIGKSLNEAILGSSKADTLIGTMGNDIIIGNGGNDKITGGLGADVLTGGSGKVSFIYNAAADSTPANPDTITDFRYNHDLIDLTNIAGISSQHGVPRFQGKLTGSGNMVLNAHSIGYIEVGGNTDVLANTSNSSEFVTTSNVSAANMEIVLVGINLHLASSDFHHV